LEAAHAQVEPSLRKLQLGHAAVQVQHGDRGVLPEKRSARAELHLGARIVVGPEAVAGDQRAVDARLHPLLVARRLEAHGARRVREPRHPGRGIGEHGGGRAERGQRSER
jgi:hypothetical protein